MTVRRTSVLQLLTAVVVLLIVGVLAFGGLAASRTISRQQDALLLLTDQYARLYAEARAQGVEPEAPEPDEVVEALPTPQRGEPGRAPTVGEVETAVRSYCDSRGNCRGPAGVTGQDGADGAQGERGPQGIQGDPGVVGGPGKDGAVGPPGPEGLAGRAPTPEEISAAVTAYCEANGGCRGPIGEKGATGDTGQSGAVGAPGPTCPDGYTATESIVMTATGPTNAVLCQTGAGT